MMETHLIIPLGKLLICFAALSNLASHIRALSCPLPNRRRRFDWFHQPCKGFRHSSSVRPGPVSDAPLGSTWLLEAGATNLSRVLETCLRRSIKHPPSGSHTSSRIPTPFFPNLFLYRPPPSFLQFLLVLHLVTQHHHDRAPPTVTSSS